MDLVARPGPSFSSVAKKSEVGELYWAIYDIESPSDEDEDSPWRGRFVLPLSGLVSMLCIISFSQSQGALLTKLALIISNPGQRLNTNNIPSSPTVVYAKLTILTPALAPSVNRENTLMTTWSVISRRLSRRMSPNTFVHREGEEKICVCWVLDVEAMSRSSSVLRY